MSKVECISRTCYRWTRQNCTGRNALLHNPLKQSYGSGLGDWQRSYRTQPESLAVAPRFPPARPNCDICTHAVQCTTAVQPGKVAAAYSNANQMNIQTEPLHCIMLKNKLKELVPPGSDLAGHCTKQHHLENDIVLQSCRRMSCCQHWAPTMMRVSALDNTSALISMWCVLAHAMYT
jgi:hypothetical protein